MSLNGWKKILENNKGLKPGHLLVFRLYMPSTGPYLVVNKVPRMVGSGVARMV